MTFSSIHFIFVFLPIVLILFYILPFRNWRNAILVLASIIFFCWVDPTDLLVLIIATLFNYVFGRFIGSSVDKEKTKVSRVYTWIAVTINLALLAFYKYLPFIGKSIKSIVPVHLNVPQMALPLGISYFAFSGIAYIFDVYYNTEKAEKNIISFFAYIIMFPKLVQGPITRYGDVEKELHSPRFKTENLIEGARRFIVGLAKKVILADSLSIVANKVFDSNLGMVGADMAWIGLVSYTLQIYFDFSGYTDMAIGLGHMFGFKLPENFNFPYISCSITEFWRRWHMSLTAWFRTYVFFPLEIARRKEKKFRQQSNILITFLLTGIWHGVGWNFLLWGVYYGLIMALESGPFIKFMKKNPQNFSAYLFIIFDYVGLDNFPSNRHPRLGIIY